MSFLKKKINFLEKFCVPAPVVGGLIFAIFTCVCYATGIAEFDFDDTLREVCMVFFFTSVGFQANLKVLKSGGKSLFIFMGLVVVLIFSLLATSIVFAVNYNRVSKEYDQISSDKSLIDLSDYSELDSDELKHFVTYLNNVDINKTLDYQQKYSHLFIDNDS